MRNPAKLFEPCTVMGIYLPIGLFAPPPWKDLLALTERLKRAPF
ncbi:MAG: hypothetical protein WA974_04720 [Thermodesulfobacteriota bacterium]